MEPRRLRAYLRLVRLPALFTAAGDPIAGWLLAAPGTSNLSEPACVAAAFAGVSIYAGGMALNDYADRERDRKGKPDRPIPAGEIPARAALVLGLLLLALGTGLAGVLSARALAGAAGLSLGVLAYDFALKRWLIAGAFAMGLVRGGNLLLGALASAHGRWPLEAAAALAAYTFVLTLASGFEDAPAPRRAVVGTALAHLAVLAGIAAAFSGGVAAIGLVLAGAILARNYLRLLADPRSAGGLVRGGVLAIPMVDAALVVGGGCGVVGLALLALPALSMATSRLGSVSGGPDR